MIRKPVRLVAALLAIVTTGALLASCRTPITQAACDMKIVASTAGTVADPALIEISGLAVSAKNPDTIWANNDSGDSARVFAMSETGAAKATYAVQGATAIDWEDIALGVGPTPGESYLYAADIGDNAENRSSIAIYRAPEPTVGAGAQTLTGVDKLTLVYPDGAKNSEAFFVDPTDGQLYLFQKVLNGGTVGIYRAPANLPGGSTTTLTKVGTITFGTGLGNSITGAAITPDGLSIAIRTYGAVHIWTRFFNESTVQAVSRPSCPGPVPAEIQGEAVAFRPDGRSYFTASEGAAVPLHRFDIAPPAPPAP
jgi:hypothetical protein